MPADGVIRLTLGTNNVYALPGSGGVTLIDAGPDYEGAWESLLAALAAHGIAATDVREVVLTHHHLDHAGLAARWQQAGARILAGRADAAALAQDAAARDAERVHLRREFLRQGVPPEAVSPAEPPSSAISPAPAAPHAPLPASGEGPGVRAEPPASSAAPPAVLRPQRYTRWPAPLRMTAVHPDRLLDDGDRLDAAGRCLRAVAAPGHTPGTILLLEPASGALCTGDHILPRMAPTSGFQLDAAGRRRPSLPRYLASLHASRALAAETRAFYPGHGEPGVDLAAAVDWTVRLLEQRARRTLAALRRGPATAYDIALRLFPHLRPHQLRATVVETAGLLDLLAERGLARAEETGDAVIWRAEESGAAGR